jgi:hypothetical protein
LQALTAVTPATIATKYTNVAKPTVAIAMLATTLQTLNVVMLAKTVAEAYTNVRFAVATYAILNAVLAVTAIAFALVRTATMQTEVA